MNHNRFTRGLTITSCGTSATFILGGLRFDIWALASQLRLALTRAHQ